MKTYRFADINFRRFWGYPCNTKNCPVFVQTKLSFNSDGNILFSVNTQIWNPKQTATYLDGDHLALLANFLEIANDKLYQTLQELWEKYGHKEIHKGSPEQEQILHPAIAAEDLPPNEYLGSEAYRNYLRSYNMETVVHNGVSYRYGHGWVDGKPIPNSDLERLEQIV